MHDASDLPAAAAQFVAGDISFDDLWVLAIEVIPQRPPDHPIGALAGLIAGLHVDVRAGGITEAEALQEVREKLRQQQLTVSPRTRE